MQVINSSNRDTLAEAIRLLVETQMEVSGLVKGATELPITPEQISTYSFALIQEVGELATELNYKPWKQNGKVNRGAVIDETADVFAFLGLLLYYVCIGNGITPIELAEAYRLKSIVNVSRFVGAAAGYENNEADLDRATKVINNLQE